jgi:glycosyltransferase involved in cell wall biosynthesis
LGIDSDEKIVLTMGHTYMKSMETLLEAFSIVVKKDGSIKLYVVGRIGSTLKGIKDKFNYLLRFIVFTGEQPFSKIPYYLSASDVLVLPMEDSNIERARFPIRLGDYMASGRPIVSNAVGEAKYVIESEECGLTCEPNDIEGFADIILKVVNNRELQERFGTRARKSAEEKYSWQNLTEKLDLIYKDTLGD